jgi:hypothetical protein
MKVSELIEEKSLLKYIPKDKMNPCDIVGVIEDNEEYFLITNTKEIYNTTNETKVFAIMRNNEFQGIILYSGCCSWENDFTLTDEGNIMS